jgi:hypothetical protein
MKLLWVSLLVLPGLPLALAQQLPTAEQLLPRVADYARQYRARMPSLECDESIVSRRVKGRKVKWEVRVEATLREVRDAQQDDFTDHYTYKTVDGKPPQPHFKVPYLVESAFVNAIGFSSGYLPACYDYRVSSDDGGAKLQLQLDAKQDLSDPSCKNTFEGFHKVVVVDAKSGIVERVERSMSARAAAQNHESFYAVIEYAPQQLGGETFWLPVRFESHDAKNEGRMVATYSNFHRFVGEMKILPGSEAPAPGPRPR